MAATFTWSVIDCERALDGGGITVAHWRCEASETVGSGNSAVTHTVFNYGEQKLTPNYSDENFIAYDSVTEANVKDWIWAADVNRTLVENGLQDSIDLLKTPTTGTGVPW